MASDTPSNATSIGLESGSEPKANRSWMSLFYFTTRRHLLPLFVGLIFTVAGGLAVPLLAVILGRIFNILTQFGGRSITAAQLMDEITIHCLYLLVLGGILWVLQSTYFSLWIIFGELQAKRARDRLFGDLLGKEIKWFDLKADGVSALLPRIQS